MSERIFKKTIEIIEKPFTTETKKRPRRKRKLETVRERCEDLIHLQWPDKEVTLKKLEMDMMTKLHLWDRTTRTAYLGRPERKHIRRVRQDVTYLGTGTRVPKEHTFTEKVTGKTGYLEILGLATMFKKNGRAWFRIHYENSNRPYHYEERLAPPFNQGSEGVSDVPKKKSISPIIDSKDVKRKSCVEADESIGERRERDSLNVREKYRHSFDGRRRIRVSEAFRKKRRARLPPSLLRLKN